MTFPSSNTSFRGIGLCLMAIVAVISGGCSSDYGDKIVVNGTEIYFDGKTVTKSDAEKLGKYLTDAEFSDGTEISVRLAKADGKWQFQMVTADSAVEDEELAVAFAVMAAEISNTIFDGAPVEYHLCDDHFKTLKVIQQAEAAPVEPDTADAQVPDAG